MKNQTVQKIKDQLKLLNKYAFTDSFLMSCSDFDVSNSTIRRAAREIGLNVSIKKNECHFWF